MKKFSKNTAIVLTVIFSIVLAIGFILSFVPMTFGAKTFVSFSGALNVSSDVSGGMYAEYDILTEDATNSDIVSSLTNIQDVLDDEGYKNANVYAIGKNKVRVEISYPKGSASYSSAYTTLSGLASGAFSLRSSNSIEEDTIVVNGAECVKKIEIFTQNDTKSMAIIFNEKGVEQYEELCAKTTTIYLVLGDYTQSISVQGVYDYSQLTLSNTDYENLKALEQKIKLGCMKIELNANTAKINTMSASLSMGGGSSTPADSEFFTSIAWVVCISAFFAIVALGIAFFAVKFCYYAILILLTVLFNAELFLGLMLLMPSVELGLSGVLSLIAGTALIYSYAFTYASKVKEEYNLGKSLNAALESTSKKQLPNLLIGNLMLLVSSLILLAFSFGELTSVVMIFAICSFLSLLTNVAIIPLLIKIGISYDGLGRKLFMLKKRGDISGIADEVTEATKEGN